MNWRKFFGKKRITKQPDQKSEIGVKSNFKPLIQEVYPDELELVYSFPIKTVLCIPGTWINITEFVVSLANTTDASTLAAGFVIMDVPNERHYEFQFLDRDDSLSDAIASSGRITSIDNKSVEEIRTHASFIYLSAVCSSLIDTSYLAYAAGEILKSGGLGIFVKTAGKGFSKDFWLNSLKEFNELTLYNLFVLESILQTEGTLFSCGMHNLGLKDMITSELDVEDGNKLLRVFNIYQFLEQPEILPGQTFTPTPESPRFRIFEEKEPPYQGVELFENPYGMWRLTLA